MLEIAAESPASGARFVRLRYDCTTCNVIMGNSVFMRISGLYVDKAHGTM